MSEARPDWLPKPNCRVVLVCGPPAAGKSTWVRQHMKPGDIYIDLDTIARHMGFSRDRSDVPLGPLLVERNRQLAALSFAPSSCTAFVIVTAASEALRSWWMRTLYVKPEDVVVLLPSRDELRQRVLADPDRKWVVDLHFRLIDEWLERERTNDPGHIDSGCDEDGMPFDPLHPWSEERA